MEMKAEPPEQQFSWLNTDVNINLLNLYRAIKIEIQREQG